MIALMIFVLKCVNEVTEIKIIAGSGQKLFLLLSFVLPVITSLLCKVCLCLPK